MIYSSPLSIPISKNKRFILNLNNYRNLHYRVLNKAKILYKECVEDQILANKETYSKVLIIYTVYQPTNRKFDIGNIISIHQKYFEDALVELGRLPDDRFNFIPMCVYCYGGVDTTNPRVDIEVINCDGSFFTKVKERLDEKIEKLYTINTRNGGQL